MRGTSRAVLALLLFAMAGPAMAIPSSDTPAPPSTLPGRPSDAEVLIGRLREIFAAAQKEQIDPKDLSARIKAILNDPAFAELDLQSQHAAFLMYGAALLETGDTDGAKIYLRRASEMAQAVPIDWRLRLRSDLITDDFADAAVTLTVLAAKYPGEISNFRDRAVFRIVHEAEKLTDATVVQRLVAALYAMHWKPDDPFSTADSVWIELIRSRIQSGDTAGAKEIVAQLREPASRIHLQFDNSFAPVAEPDFDIRKAFQDRIAELTAQLETTPDSLSGVNTVARMLVAVGRTDEALALLNGAIARYRKDPKAFQDAEENINWSYDALSDALIAAGRIDDAIAAMRDGAKAGEGGSPNVSQSINLGDIFVDYDRPKEALDAVAAMDEKFASPYGRMALADVRLRAYAALGDQKNLKTVADYMRAHVSDNELAFINSMLAIGDNDAAAATAIVLLRDPSRRESILAAFQDFQHDSDGARTRKAMLDAWHALRDRPDVAAEVRKAGRIMSLPLRASDY